mmetsp:Transcript_18551/g.49805  ORF Transcript_18551/g.49805 Transcript_18551/m.49805 type:complete len:215 (+) Transcript_18551:446-1090(+)
MPTHRAGPRSPRICREGPMGKAFPPSGANRDVEHVSPRRCHGRLHRNRPDAGTSSATTADMHAWRGWSRRGSRRRPKRSRPRRGRPRRGLSPSTTFLKSGLALEEESGAVDFREKTQGGEEMLLVSFHGGTAHTANICKTHLLGIFVKEHIRWLEVTVLYPTVPLLKFMQGRPDLLNHVHDAGTVLWPTQGHDVCDSFASYSAHYEKVVTLDTN